MKYRQNLLCRYFLYSEDGDSEMVFSDKSCEYEMGEGGIL